MKKLNEFTPDSVWYIGSTKRTLKEWAMVYGMELKTVQERMKNGNTILRALRKTDQDVNREKYLIKKKKSFEDLKAEFTPPITENFDLYEELEKDIPKRNYSTLTESYINSILYGKDNINQLTQY